MRRAIQFLLAAAILMAAVPFAGAQTTLPFTIKTQQGSNVQMIGDGGTLAFPADGIGLATNGSLTITYTGVGTNVFANVNSIVLTGSTDFTVTSAPDLSQAPLNLPPGSSPFGVQVSYNPSNSKGASAKLTFYYNTDTIRAGTFTVNLTGTAPEFAYTYAVQPNGNTTLLSSGATIQLPLTAFTDTSAVLITITNRGTGTGTVNRIALTGSDRFALLGVSFMPATVDPGRALAFSVRFAPNDFPAVTGNVQVDVIGSSLKFQVTGAGLGPKYEYAVVTDKGSSTIAAGGLIQLPDATIGVDKVTTVTVRVTNTGNDNGTLTASTLQVKPGTGFALIEGPFLPYTLAPDGSFTFKVQFTPTQPGKASGSLLVGSDNFTLAANALGPNLTYSYTAAGGTTSLASGGTVVLPAAAVGQTSTVQFTVKNDGTAPQDVFSISAAGTGTVFAASGLPSLPRRLEAGASVTFTVTFAPVTTGSATGALKIDTQIFTLSAVGNPPAALPSYSFSGTSGTVDAAQQPAFGLSLADTYPLALNGTLTLTFTSDVYANDPAVQFSAGGRTVAFTIPAGSKQAVFPNAATQMRVQTGTVAGTILVVPTFASAQGGIDLTPATPPALLLTIPQSAPRLTSAIWTSKVTNTITLQVTGYATGRNITQMDFQFTPVSTESLGTTKVSIPVTATFDAWYQSSASAAYGSQFSATVTFTMGGDITDTKNIVNLSDTIQSVAVTLTNRQGVSSSSTVALR